MSAQQHEALLGTAPEASAFFLIEVRGAWAGKIFESDLPEPVLSFLRGLEQGHPGLRVQFIRVPRRRHGAVAVYLCRVGAAISSLELAQLDDVVQLDVGQWLANGTHPGAEAVAQPLTLVCGHGRRDVCCALLGKPVFEAITHASLSDESDALPTVWQASHMGGHRFAPVVLSLPDGHCYGRFPAAEAEDFLRAQAARRVHAPEQLRGCTKDPAWLQAASVALRVATDERDFDALLPGASMERSGDTLRVTVPTTRGPLCVMVEQRTIPEALRPASCGDAPTPTVSWLATLTS